MRGLLQLDGVTHRYPRGSRGRHDRIALRDVSLTIGAGELVGVWGPRNSGRSTLALVAVGITLPGEGVVRFDGADLVRQPMLGVRGGIGYCDRDFDPVMAQTVLEHVAAPLLSSTGTTNSSAEQAAYDQLERVGGAELSGLEPDELDPAETMRVAIARATISRPRLLVVDEPTTGVRASQERPLLRLLHSFARDEGMAVLMTADDAAALAGVDRALSLNDGTLRGPTDALDEEPRAVGDDDGVGRVVELRRARRADA